MNTNKTNDCTNFTFKINTTKNLILTSLITQLTQEPASAKAHSCNKKSAKSLCLQLLHQGKIKATVS